MLGKEVLGNYGKDSYCNVVVTKDLVTIKNGRFDYTIPSSAFSLQSGKGTDVDYDFHVQETGAQGTLSFYESSGILLGVEVTYSDNSGADFCFHVDASKVLGRLPLDGYVSLDDQGEFGTIPMTDDIKNLLLI
ncbi:hypothetical protein V6615_12170 [Oscillospiraceae bacterium PP1C4]